MAQAEDNHDPWPLERYRPYLLALARLRLNTCPWCRIDVSDVVHDALLKAHRCRGQFRGTTEAEWRAYLHRILANTIADAFRERPRERPIQQDLDQSSARLEEWLVASHTSPSQKAQRGELLLRLAEALDQLDQDERTALELRYFQQPAWALADIAAHLHRPTPKAVAGLLARGLKKLRKLLREYQ